MIPYKKIISIAILINTLIIHSMENQSPVPTIIFADNQILTLTPTEWNTLLNESTYIKGLVHLKSGTITKPIELKEFDKDTFKLLLDTMSSSQPQELLKPYDLEELVHLAPIVDYLGLQSLHKLLTQLITQHIMEVNPENKDTVLEASLSLTNAPVLMDHIDQTLTQYLKSLTYQHNNSIQLPDNNKANAYFNSDRNAILVISADSKTLQILNTEDNNSKPIPIFPSEHNFHFTSAAWNPANTSEFIMTIKNSYSLWVAHINLKKMILQKLNVSLKHAPPTLSDLYYPNNAFYTPDGSKIVTFRKNKSKDTADERTKDTMVFLWNTQTGNLLQTFSNSDNEHVKIVVVSPDSTKVAVVSNNSPTTSNIKIWSLTTSPSNPLVTLSEPHRIHSLAFSPDGKKIIASSYTKSSKAQYKIWDVNTGKHLATLDGKGRIGSFSPDGSKILTMNKKQITVWDGELYTKLYTLSHDNIINAHFSPDSLQIITVDKKGSVRISDVNYGISRKITLYDNTDAQISDAYFSPDSSTIIMIANKSISFFTKDKICAKIIDTMSLDMKISVLTEYNDTDTPSTEDFCEIIADYL